MKRWEVTFTVGNETRKHVVVARGKDGASVLAMRPYPGAKLVNAKLLGPAFPRAK